MPGVLTSLSTSATDSLQLTNQKNEMQAMHKRILSLEDRVKHLELDIGEDEK